MRPVQLPGVPSKSAPLNVKVDWCIDAITKISRYSKEGDADSIADSYSVTNLPATPVRTLNVSTAAAADVAAVLAQFLTDLHKRNINRGS
jgi:hypothetical protein